MIKSTKYILLLCFLISLPGIQNCDFLEEICEYTTNKNVPIKLREHFKKSTVIEWGSYVKDLEYPELGHERILRFHFPKESYPDLAIEDICSVHPFSASLKITYDKDSPPVYQDTKYRLVGYFPSIPPSGKVLDAIGTLGSAHIERDKAEASLLVEIPPNPGAKNLEATWLEFGIEVSFSGSGNYLEDLERFKQTHRYAILDIEYFYF